MRLLCTSMSTSALPCFSSETTSSNTDKRRRFRRIYRRRRRRTSPTENQAFRDDGNSSYSPTMLPIDDDSFITTVSCLEISPPDESSCYHTATSLNELTENIDPEEFVKPINVDKANAEKTLYGINQHLNESGATKMERAEVDKLIAYILFLLTKRRHHPTDVNSNCIEREPFTFKKFIQMFRTARSASPEKERKFGLLEGLFNRSEARSSIFVKKNALPFGLLLNALAFSIDADGDDNYEAVKKLVHTESNEISNKTNSIHSFFNAFIISYFALKNSPAELPYLDLLDCLAKNKPSGQKIRNAVNILIGKGFKSVGSQTEMENRMYQQRGRGLNRDRCTVIEMKRNARRAKLVADDDMRSETESSSFISDDLQDAPLPKAIVKPRSVSRHRKLCANPQLSSMSNPNYNDLSHASPGLSSAESESLSAEVTSDSGLSSSFHVSLPQCMTSTPVKSPPPPPPLPPPPSFFSSPCMKPTVLSPFAVVKSEKTYKKNRATNTIHWEAVKPEFTVNSITVFSGPDKCEANFSEEQRERLEKVFERVKKTSVDSKSRFGNKTHVPVVQLLNEKRALSLGIVLAKFRPVTVNELVNMLESQAVNNLDSDTLDTLLKHYPLEDEIKLFKKYTSPEMLKDAELFCYLASRRSLLKLRIELKVIVDFMKTDINRHSEYINAVLVACKNVYNSPSINIFLRRCLQYGNFLNQSTFAAHASGFTLNSLLDILRAKGTSENIRLVDILAEMAEPNLRQVVEHIGTLKVIRGNTIEDLEKSVGSSQRKVKKAMDDLHSCGDKDLYAFYAPSLHEWIKKYEELVAKLVEIRNKEKELQTFYCTPNMPLEKLLTTLLDAILLFQEAITSAREKELRRSRQSRNRDIMNGKDGSNTPLKRRRNYLESPNVKDLVYLLDTTDV